MSFNLILNPNANLWNSFLKGDKLAFERLYKQYADHLLRYGLKISGDRRLLEDCMHDLFVELWSSRSRLSPLPDENIKFYLFKALRYKILQSKKASDAIDFVEWDDFTRFPSANLSENETDSREREDATSTQLRKEIKKLPKRQQEAIYLRFYQQFTNDEVAVIMGVTYQSACRFIYKGLKVLHEVIKVD